jgi:hypothetical protein
VTPDILTTKSSKKNIIRSLFFKIPSDVRNSLSSLAQVQHNRVWGGGNVIIWGAMVEAWNKCYDLLKMSEDTLELGQQDLEEQEESSTITNSDIFETEMRSLSKKISNKENLKKINAILLEESLNNSNNFSSKIVENTDDIESNNNNNNEARKNYISAKEAKENEEKQTSKNLQIDSDDSSDIDENWATEIDQTSFKFVDGEEKYIKNENTTNINITNEITQEDNEDRLTLTDIDKHGQILNDILFLGNEIYKLSEFSKLNVIYTCSKLLLCVKKNLEKLKNNTDESENGNISESDLAQETESAQKINRNYSNLNQKLLYQIKQLGNSIFELSRFLKLTGIQTCKKQLLGVKNFLNNLLNSDVDKLEVGVKDFINNLLNDDVDELESIEAILGVSLMDNTTKIINIGENPENDNEELSVFDNFNNSRNDFNSNLGKKRKQEKSKVIWKIFILDNDKNCFYIIRYDEKEILFTLSTLKKLLGLVPHSYVYILY